MKVCTIGGGSGMPIVNKSLVDAGFEDIHSIVTTFDSGGDSGRMRTDERGKILAYSDYWRSLISIWKDGKQKAIWEEILRYRDGRGRNFGNIFFQFLAEKEGNLSKVDAVFATLIDAQFKGEVIPVSLSPADVCFRTINGKEYYGEHNLDDLRMSLDKVEEVWLEPNVQANPEAIETLKTANLIILCPGTMYGSIIPNFLPVGMREAYNESKSKKILMTNIMSVANEDEGFCQDDYVKVFGNYLRTERPFDYILMADLENLDKDLLKKALLSYSLEHSSPIKYNSESTVETILADIATIDETNLRLRHDNNKVAEFFKSFEP